MARTVYNAYQVKRVIQWNGVKHTFTRYKKNEYNEPTDTPEATIILPGIFHESSSRLVLVLSEATQVRPLPKPGILVTWADFQATPVKPGDVVMLNGLKYTVQGASDLQQLNVAVDITLAVEDSGEARL